MALRSSRYLSALALASTLAALPLASGAQSRPTLVAKAVTINLGMQGRVMWIDGSANIDRITTIEGVRDIVERCRKANISTLVVDVKPVSGQVLYDSKLAERMTEWKGKKYPAFDVLAAFLAEGKKAGMDVHASLNIFSEGHKYFDVGLAYRKPEWQSVTLTVERSLVAMDGSRLPVRAGTEPEETARNVVYDDEYVLRPTTTPGKQLAVALDEDRRVAGMIDPALLDDEPLLAPENGQLLVLDGEGMDWASSHLRAADTARFDAVGKRLPITKAPAEKVAAFVNPLHPEARQYEIELLKEVARNYDVDGIVFDRMRYAGLTNDFSDLTRRSFEQWMGKPVKNWPADILQFDPRPGAPFKRGPLFKPWLEFRARVIRGFVHEATNAVRAVKPNIQFSAYVGSWFTEYYGVGVNWGSEKFAVRTPWATADYNEAGYAEYLDWLSTGCYYGHPFRSDARNAGASEGASVEAAAELSTLVVSNAIPVYAGLYALNYQGRPQAFSEAIRAAVRNSQGVMLFDISHIYDYGWWPLLEQAFQSPAPVPHRNGALTAKLRAVEDAGRSPGAARAGATMLPAVPYQPGGG
jgi:uncharacterized lipoprotein YddW (UPF0748 family)